MLNMIKSSLLLYLKNKTHILFFIFFPFFLVFLIGNICSGMFENDAYDTKSNIQIHYIDEGNSSLKHVFEKFKEVADSNPDYSFTFTQDDSLTKAKSSVAKDKSILLHLNNDKIDFYCNNDSLTKPTYVFQMINSISKSYNLINTIYSINPEKADTILNSTESSENLFNINKLSKDTVSSSIGYYGIAEIGLMVFFVLCYPLDKIINDRTSNIKNRINLSSVSNFKYYMCEYISTIILFEAWTVIVCTLCNLFLKVNYGSYFLPMLFAAFGFITLMAGIGILASIFIKTPEAFSSFNKISEIITTFLTFVGGGYIAFVGDSGTFLDILGKISPLRWFNNSLFKSIYSSDNTLLYNFVSVCILISLIFCLIIFIFSRREAKINA